MTKRDWLTSKVCARCGKEACGGWFEIPLCPECYSYIEDVLRNRTMRDLSNALQWLLEQWEARE